MSGRNSARVILVAPLLVSGLALSGCMSAPTYGTGVSANKQLATDVSTMFSFKPRRTHATDYAPRPELVKPGARTAELPPPQESIVKADASQWPESPEERRARIRAEATENRDKLGWEPEVVNDVARPKKTAKLGVSANYAESGVAPISQAQTQKREREEIQQALAEQKQGSPTVRRTLTEPPLEYRQPAPTAATGDLGEEEYKKERRLKRQARQGSSWRDLVPWL